MYKYVGLLVYRIGLFEAKIYVFKILYFLLLNYFYYLSVMSFYKPKAIRLVKIYDASPFCYTCKHQWRIIYMYSCKNGSFKIELDYD